MLFRHYILHFRIKSSPRFPGPFSCSRTDHNMSKMFEIAMPTFSHSPNVPSVLQRSRSKRKLTIHRRLCLSSSVFVQPEENGKLFGSKKKIQESFYSVSAHAKSNPKINTVGVLGGVSAFSTLIFLEKLMCWSSRNTKNSFAFVVCNDPALSLGFKGRKIIDTLLIKNLRQRRQYLEKAGAGCIVMPCHISHVWHEDIFEGCSVEFLNIADCVAHELQKARMKPLETGSNNVRIGLIGNDDVLNSGSYREKLQNQGFEVVLPDKATMKNILNPVVETLQRKDLEGARNLLRIAIHVLLMKAANAVILASDEFQGLLPHDDPLLHRCIDPMDSLAQATVTWTTSLDHLTSKTLNL